MDRSEKAKSLFKEGYNCSQSVFLTFEDLYGLDRQTALKISSPFGAGFGMLREVCGCVSGMMMALGAVEGYCSPEDREGKKQLYKEVQALAHAFEKENGSIICRELLGLQKGETLKEPAVRTEEYYRKRPCAELCALAAGLLQAHLEEKGKL